MRSTLKKIFYFFDSSRAYNLFDKPIFIISAPRSGSTLLYGLVSKFKGVYGYSVETADIWWRIFPRERLPDQSDLVTDKDCTPDKIDAFRRLLYRMIMWDREEHGEQVSILEKLGLKKIRYVEKTIANCFHLEAIERIFPDCYFIWLIRDPRATYSSMLVGWKGSKRAQVYQQLNPLKDRFDIELFPYPLPPNWKKYMLSKTEAVAFAWALVQYIEVPMRFFRQIPEERKIFVRYENLTKDPVQILRTISEKFNLIFTDELFNVSKQLPLSRTTVIKPMKNKWKKLHGDIIDSPIIYPLLNRIAEELNYNIFE